MNFIFKDIRANVIKLFTAVSMPFHKKLERLSLALALPANIILGWKGLPGTSALTYYEKA
jgi:hypothetical protein